MPGGSRPAREGGDVLVADATRGCVEDAQQAHPVGRVMDEAQVGDEILDLAPAVETLGADELVRQPGSHEGIFKCARLCVGAVHDGAITGLETSPA